MPRACPVEFSRSLLHASLIIPLRCHGLAPWHPIFSLGVLLATIVKLLRNSSKKPFFDVLKVSFHYLLVVRQAGMLHGTSPWHLDAEYNYR